MTIHQRLAAPGCALILLLAGCGGSAPPLPTPEPLIKASEATLTLYNRSCISCHARGTAGAPRTGDAAAWTARLDQGREVLLTRTRSGWAGMPPMGMCRDCSDEQFVDLIEYMAQGKINKP